MILRADYKEASGARSEVQDPTRSATISLDVEEAIGAYGAHSVEHEPHDAAGV